MRWLSKSTVLGASLSVCALLMSQAQAQAPAATTSQTAPSVIPGPTGLPSAPTRSAAEAAALINADPVLHAREQALAHQLRCLVCQNQSIAESNAELAQDLRRQVHEQMVAGRSDRQIIDFMTERYGDFVLYRPPLKATTAVLWLGPLLLLTIAAFIAQRFIRARRAAAADLSEAEHARAAQLLQATSDPVAGVTTTKNRNA